MPGVKSVERFSLALAVSDGEEDGTLTKSQTTANCVPFLGCRVTDAEATPDRYGNYYLDASFPDSTHVRALGSTSSGSATHAEISVVEFDGTNIIVIKDSINKTSVSDVVATLPGAASVDLTKAFVYFPHDVASGSNALPYNGKSEHV